MKMKTTTAFRAYSAARARKSFDEKEYLVRSLNKDGSISKMVLSHNERRLNAFECAEAAERRREQLEKMNPGSRYIVVEK